MLEVGAMAKNLAQITPANFLAFELKIFLRPIGLNATFNILPEINLNKSG
jgi:hypothetical protein